MVAYAMPLRRKEKESKRRSGERDRDLIKLIDLRFER